MAVREGSPRLVAVVFEVSNLARSAALYREAFGLDLHRSLHDLEDRWIGGEHAAISWSDGAFMHFALYQARTDERTAHAQVSFEVADIDEAHARAAGTSIEVIHGPRAQPWGRSARYRDPDGNVVELTQPQ